jgi:hypothetical protein
MSPSFELTPVVDMMEGLNIQTTNNQTKFKKISECQWVSHPDQFIHPNYRLVYIIGEDEEGKKKVVSYELLFKASIEEDPEHACKLIQNLRDYIWENHCSVGLMCDIKNTNAGPVNDL